MIHFFFINTYLYKYNIIPICINIYLYKYNIIIPIYINTYLWCRRNSTASNINFLLQRNHEFFNTLATWIHNRSCDRLFVGSRKLSMTNNFFDSGAQPLATTNLVLSKKKKKKYCRNRDDPLDPSFSDIVVFFLLSLFLFSILPRQIFPRPDSKAMGKRICRWFFEKYYKKRA